MNSIPTTAKQLQLNTNSCRHDMHLLDRNPLRPLHLLYTQLQFKSFPTKVNLTQSPPHISENPKPEVVVNAQL